jgi:hypothetical protein
VDRRFSRASIVVLAMAGYVIVSHLLGEQYPFGPLSMFSGGLRESSRVVGRTADGRVCELSSFDRWSCPQAVDLVGAGDERCRRAAGHAELDRKAQSFIVAHAGPKEEGAPVDVVRRIFTIPRPGGPVLVEDCVLAACAAKEVAGTCSSIR